PRRRDASEGMMTTDSVTPRPLDFPSLRRAGGGPAPARFYERFGADNQALDPAWSRITTQASEAPYAPRRDGLRVLLINAPIREWPYPNILPIRHAYVPPLSATDRVTTAVLDLYRERQQPVHSAPWACVAWPESRMVWM